MIMIEHPTAATRMIGPTRRPSRDLRDRVSRRVRTQRARALVARTLAQLLEDASIIDACAPMPHLQPALDEAIAGATVAAVDTLIDGLADLLDQLPESAIDSWDRACLAADLGYE